ncbi:hypothetical protein LTR85_012180 [Meristemomyces frigidus]|nr:hypothetical protein LTR85_012180 [Meristemomyces frigidus]
MKPFSAMQEVYRSPDYPLPYTMHDVSLSPDYPSPYTPACGSTDFEHQYGAFVRADGHSRGRPNAPDKYADEVGDHIISLARTIEDRVIDIINSERYLLRAYKEEAMHDGRTPTPATSKLPPKAHQCFHGLKVALLRDSRTLEAAAKSHLRRTGSLPPAPDIFTTLPGEAGRIQDHVREALRTVGEACLDEAFSPEDVSFVAEYRGATPSLGVDPLGRRSMDRGFERTRTMGMRY